MSRRCASYLPLTLTLLFGLAITLLPASPALSSNLPFGVAIQEPNSLPNLAPNSLVRYSHTLLVGSNGSPTQNGAALLAAMSIISNANPSLTNPYLLKLEPGTYDLGNQALALVPYVDLEGSGEGTTFLASSVGSGSPDLGTLVLAAHSEARFVTVTNGGSNTFQIAICVPPSAINHVRLFHLTATTAATNGATNSYGLYNNGGTLTVQDSTFTATGSANNLGLYNNAGTLIVQNTLLTAAGGTQSIGLSNIGGSATVQNSTLTTSGGSLLNYGLFSNGGTITVTKVTVQNSTLTASGGSKSVGLFNAVGTALVQDSTLTASGGLNENDGLANADNTATIQNSTLTASGGPNENDGLKNGSGGTALVHNSILTGLGSDTGSVGLSNTAGTARVGASQLIGATAPSIGLSECPASYDVNFVSLTGGVCH